MARHHTTPPGLQIGHRLDDRLCTTLIRVCSQHGQAGTALSLYDWMRSPTAEGGAGLTPTVFTYTAAMRAALSGSLMERALQVGVRLWPPAPAAPCSPPCSPQRQARQGGAARRDVPLTPGHAPAAQVWDDAVASKCEIDCRLCTTLVEVCGRKGDTDRALQAYAQVGPLPAVVCTRLRAGLPCEKAALRGARPPLLVGPAMRGLRSAAHRTLGSPLVCCADARRAARQPHGPLCPRLHCGHARRIGGRPLGGGAVHLGRHAEGRMQAHRCVRSPPPHARLALCPLQNASLAHALPCATAAWSPGTVVSPLCLLSGVCRHVRVAPPRRPRLRRRHLRLRRGRPVAAGREPV